MTAARSAAGTAHRADGVRHDESTRSVVETKLRDKSFLVRFAAVRALKELGVGPSRRELKAALAVETDSETRELIRGLLGAKPRR